MTRISVTAIVMVSIARIFGVQEFGKIALAITITSILFFVADFGLTIYSTREVARDNSIIGALAATSIRIKIVSSGLTLFIAWLVTTLLNYPPDTTLLIYLFSGSAIIFSFSSFFIGILRGSNRFDNEAIIYFVQNVMLLLLVLLVIKLDQSIVNIAFAFIASRVAGLLTSLYFYYRLKGKHYLSASFLTVKDVSRKSFPFATHALFGIIYMQADTVFLSKMSGDIEVGLYQAAMRIIIVLLYLQEIMVTAFFPSLSKLYKYSIKELIKKSKRLNFYLFILALPLSLSITLIGSMIIDVVYTPEYSNAALFLQILSSLILLRFLGSTYGILLSASDNQHLRMFSVIMAFLLNIGINSVLIPKYGAMGAAITAMITNFFMLAIYVYFIKSRLNTFLIHSSFIRVIALNLMLGLFIYSFRSAGLIYIVPTAIIIYALLTYRYILTSFEKKNLSEMVSSIFNIFTKIEKKA